MKSSGGQLKIPMVALELFRCRTSSRYDFFGFSLFVNFRLIMSGTQFNKVFIFQYDDQQQQPDVVPAPRPPEPVEPPVVEDHTPKKISIEVLFCRSLRNILFYAANSRLFSLASTLFLRR